MNIISLTLIQRNEVTVENEESVVKKKMNSTTEFIKATLFLSAGATGVSVALGYAWSVATHAPRAMTIKLNIISTLASMAISFFAACMLKNGMNPRVIIVCETSAKLVLNLVKTYAAVKLGVIGVGVAAAYVGTVLLSESIVLKEISSIDVNSLLAAS